MAQSRELPCLHCAQPDRARSSTVACRRRGARCAREALDLDRLGSALMERSRASSRASAAGAFRRADAHRGSAWPTFWQGRSNKEVPTRSCPSSPSRRPPRIYASSASVPDRAGEPSGRGARRDAASARSAARPGPLQSYAAETEGCSRPASEVVHGLSRRRRCRLRVVRKSVHSAPRHRVVASPSSTDSRRTGPCIADITFTPERDPSLRSRSKRAPASLWAVGHVDDLRSPPVVQLPSHVAGGRHETEPVAFRSRAAATASSRRGRSSAEAHEITGATRVVS